MELICKHFSELTASELYEIYRLRVSVFVVEQNCAYQDVDEADRTAWHIWLQDEGGIAAYARVLAPGTVFPDVSIGRVTAVRRREGLGRRIVLAAIDAAISMMDTDAIVLIAIYPGHAEGELEGRLVGEKLSKLDRHDYTVACFRMMNSPTSPYFYIVEGR